MNFWNWYTQRLLNDEKFQQDVIARKTFSKLRGAIAGLYQRKRRPKEAEIAYKQSLDLYPDSPEANTRYAAMLQSQRRFDDIKELMAKLETKDPHNGSIQKFLANSKTLIGMEKKLAALDKKVANPKQRLNPNEALQMMQYAQQLNYPAKVNQAARMIHNTPNMPLNFLKTESQILFQMKQIPLAQQCIDVMLKRFPNNWETHVEHAALLARQGKTQDAYNAATKAISLGKDKARQVFRKENSPYLRNVDRFAVLRQIPQFKNAINAGRTGGPGFGSPPGLNGLPNPLQPRP